MSDETIGNSWLAELEDQHTDESAKAEVSRRDTFRTGNYRMSVKQIKDKKLPEDNKTPGRLVLSILANVQMPNEKVQTIWFDTSPEPYKSVVDEEGTRLKVPKGHPLYTPAFKHDLAYKNWCELENIISPKGKPSFGDIARGLDGLEFGARISESFVDENGQFQNYQTEEEREYLVSKNYEPKNFVMSLRK